MMPIKEKPNAICGGINGEKKELSTDLLAVPFSKSKRNLATACVDIDQSEEQALAEIGVSIDLSEWPEY